MAAPLAGEPIALVLLDSVRRDLVQDQRSEESIEDLQDLPVPVGAALVQVRVILQVGFRELAERDVGKTPDAVRPSRIRVRSFASMSFARCLSDVSQLARYRLRLTRMS